MMENEIARHVIIIRFQLFLRFLNEVQFPTKKSIDIPDLIYVTQGRGESVK